MRPEELAAKVAKLAGDFETAQAILISIVNSKRAGVPNPDAWTAAFTMVDAWTQEEGEGQRPEMVRCPDCEQVLPNNAAKGERGPVRIDCGPEHVLHYRDFSVTVGGGVATVVPHTVRTEIPNTPVFGDAPACDCDNGWRATPDGPVPCGAAVHEREGEDDAGVSD